MKWEELIKLQLSKLDPSTCDLLLSGQNQKNSDNYYFQQDATNFKDSGFNS
jgi:hypothetical protein